MENGTLFCVAEMHQGHNLCKFGEILQKWACNDKLFPFRDSVEANKFYSMQECSTELLDLVCIPVSLLPPQDTVYL